LRVFLVDKVVIASTPGVLERETDIQELLRDSPVEIAAATSSLPGVEARVDRRDRRLGSSSTLAGFSCGWLGHIFYSWCGDANGSSGLSFVLLVFGFGIS